MSLYYTTLKIVCQALTLWEAYLTRIFGSLPTICMADGRGIEPRLLLRRPLFSTQAPYRSVSHPHGCNTYTELNRVL